MYVNYVDWHTHPFRSDRWLEAWLPALDRALAFGAESCFLTRSIDDPLHFRQVSTWENKEDFELYWFSDEIAALREEAFQYYNKPVLPSWHATIAEASAGGASEQVEEPVPEGTDEQAPAEVPPT